MTEESKVLTVREACRRRVALDGADAQALEAALSQVEREKVAVEAELAASAKELAIQRTLHMQWRDKAEKAEAENARLRELIGESADIHGDDGNQAAEKWLRAALKEPA